jgi:hypothetical protein
MDRPDQPDEHEVELRVLTSSRDLDDYDILALNMISAAVPHNTTESFRRLIWGAMVTYAFGNTSVDHVLRRYDYIWQRFKRHAYEVTPQILALRKMVITVDRIANALESKNVGDAFGPVCAKSALCRLEASFKAAYGLVRKHYIFETESIVRLILEQLAWATVASTCGDKEVQDLQPTKCISALKKHYPGAGRLYGELSQGAHIDPVIARNYIHFHLEGKRVARRSSGDALGNGKQLLELAVIYLKIVQELFTPLTAEEYKTLAAELSQLYSAYAETEDRT